MSDLKTFFNQQKLKICVQYIRHFARQTRNPISAQAAVREPPFGISGSGISGSVHFIFIFYAYIH